MGHVVLGALLQGQFPVARWLSVSPALVGTAFSVLVLGLYFARAVGVEPDFFEVAVRLDVRGVPKEDVTIPSSIVALKRLVCLWVDPLHTITNARY